jgi:hypothetical protein
MIRKWAPCSTMKGVVYDKEMGPCSTMKGIVYDKEMGTVLHDEGDSIG